MFLGNQKKCQVFLSLTKIALVELSSFFVVVTPLHCMPKRLLRRCLSCHEVIYLMCQSVYLTIVS